MSRQRAPDPRPDPWPTPPAKKPHGPGILALWAGVLAMMGVMVAAVHWRDAIAALVHPAPATVRLAAGPQDRESAHFVLCHGPHRYNCAIDGDTIWYKGVKYRVADINAPEISDPACDAELDLGEKAADRLLVLLNEGPFTLVPLPDRDEDVYGRKLRTLTRGGQSIGEVLVAEGMAERWVGFRRNWCN